MKIKINENETYEIELNKEFNKGEFIILVERLNKVVKLLGRDEVLDSISTSKIIRKKRKYNIYVKNPFRKNREITIQAYKMYYFGNEDERDKFFKDILGDRITKERSVADWMAPLRKKWNITAEEVGLKRFPKKGETKSMRNNLNEWRI